MDKPIRGRCALCRCRAKFRVYGIKVCHYHIEHGESDPDCPYCFQYKLFDARWTYTVTGQKTPNKVQVRQMRHPNTIFLDNNGELVLDIISVSEPAPSGFKNKMRQSVVMIGVGLQLGTEFTITQWASDWERDLLEAARPTLALANRIFTIGCSAVSVLAGDGYSRSATWPTVNVRQKMMDVRPLLNAQDIRPNGREDDITDDQAHRKWTHRTAPDRESVWRHNYLDVLDASMRVFQIEWPEPEDEDAE